MEAVTAVAFDDEVLGDTAATTVALTTLLFSGWGTAAAGVAADGLTSGLLDGGVGVASPRFGACVITLGRTKWCANWDPGKGSR